MLLPHNPDRSLEERANLAVGLFEFVRAAKGTAEDYDTLLVEGFEVAVSMLKNETWIAPHPEDPHGSPLVDYLIAKEVHQDHPFWDYILPGDAE